MMKELEKYSHLWDGSEKGWKLHHIDHAVWTVIFLFNETGPTKEEIVKLREIVQELSDLKLSEVWDILKGKSFYKVNEEMGNLETQWLKSKADKIDLKFRLESKDIGSYIPISPKGEALIIEDNEIARIVIERMLAAGVPVEITTHVD